MSKRGATAEEQEKFQQVVDDEIVREIAERAAAKINREIQIEQVKKAVERIAVRIAQEKAKEFTEQNDIAEAAIKIAREVASKLQQAHDKAKQTNVQSSYANAIKAARKVEEEVRQRSGDSIITESFKKQRVKGPLMKRATDTKRREAVKRASADGAGAGDGDGEGRPTKLQAVESTSSGKYGLSDNLEEARALLEELKKSMDSPKSSDDFLEHAREFYEVQEHIRTLVSKNKQPPQPVQIKTSELVKGKTRKPLKKERKVPADADDEVQVVKGPPKKVFKQDLTEDEPETGAGAGAGAVADAGAGTVADAGKVKSEMKVEQGVKLERNVPKAVQPPPSAIQQTPQVQPPSGMLFYSQGGLVAAPAQQHRPTAAAAAPPPPPPQQQGGVTPAAVSAEVPMGGQEVKEEKPSPQSQPDAITLQDAQGQPVAETKESEVGVALDPAKGDAPPPPGGVETIEGEGGETAGDGADGRDDLLDPDEAKTLLREDFRWVTQDTNYFTRGSRGKLGYGQGAENNVQPIEPFGVAIKPAKDSQRYERVFKQTDDRFEPFRGQHKIISQKKDERRSGEAVSDDVQPFAKKPFAKVGGEVIWIPFYGKTAKTFFSAGDYEELTSHVHHQGSELKLKAPPPDSIRKMQETIDDVRASLKSYDLPQASIRHGDMMTRYAEWLELKQIMKAIAKYQKTTTGMYNQAGLFSGNLREAVSRAIDDAVGKVSQKRKSQLGRGLEATKRTRTGPETKDETAGFQPFNPFMTRNGGTRRVNTTLPRFF